MDKRLLAVFWSLAESGEQDRHIHVDKLLKILTINQTEEEELCKELQYTLKRLVRGLASDRKFARHGYSTALTQVLRHFKCITVTSIIDLIKEELKITKGDLKSEQSNTILGRVMAYLTIIQSDRILEADDSQIKTVVQSLNKIRKDKILLHQICTDGLIQLISKVSTKSMKINLWPQLQKELTAGWDECDPDTLIILITVIEYHQEIADKKFLNDHWGSKKLISEKSMVKIGNIMAKSTLEHPVIHPVCLAVLDDVVKKPEKLLSFCKKVLKECLLHQAVPKKFLCFQLIQRILCHVTTVEQITVILSESLVGLLMKLLQDKDQPLYTSSKELVQTFVTVSQEISDPEVQLTMVLRLLQPPGSVFFDNVTKTSTVSGIIRNLNGGATESLADLLMDVILGGNKIGHKATIDSEIVIKWAIPKLASIVTQTSKASDATWQLKMLQFLFFHGFFHDKKKSSKQGNKQPDNFLTPELVHLMQENFFRALNKLTTFSPGRGSKYQQHCSSILQKLVKYVEELLSSEAKAVPRKELTESSLNHWNKVYNILSKIVTKNEKSGKIGEAHAFEMLFMHLSLQLFHDPKAAGDALQDLYICYEKAFKKKKKLKQSKENTEDGEDEPEWIEVVTDVLLSLLSQNSHLLRTVVKTVYTLLCPHVTSASLQLIIDVLKSTGNDEESVVDFEDDDEEDMDNETSGNNNDKGRPSEADITTSELSSDDSESESEDEQEGVDNHIKASLKAALGPAAPASDQEDSEDDLSDSEMEKLDDVLASAFRSMRTGKRNNKEKRLQLKHYKMRCLDLIEVLVQGETPTGFLLELLDPLLDILEDTHREKDMKDLYNRAVNVYHGLVKTKKFVNNNSVDVDVLPDLVQDLVKKSTTVTGVPMVTEVSNAILFVIRVIHDIEECSGTLMGHSSSLSIGNNDSTKKSDHLCKVHNILRKALQDYCKRRDSLLNHVLFTVMIEKQPVLMWPLLTQLLNLAQDDTVRIFCRTHVCSMVASLLNKNTVSNLEKDSWMKHSKDIILQFLKIFGNVVTENNMKPRFLHDVLLVLHKVIQLTSNEVVQEVVPHSTIDEIEKVKGIFKSKDMKSKDMKSMCNKLSSIVTKRLQQDQNSSPDKQKRKRKSESVDVAEKKAKMADQQQETTNDAIDLQLTDKAMNSLQLVADQAEYKKKIKKKKLKKIQQREAHLIEMRKSQKIKNNKLKKKQKKVDKLSNGSSELQSNLGSGPSPKKKKNKQKKEKTMVS